MKCMAAKIMIMFNPLVPLTVHRDDKLSDFTRHKSVDWLPAVDTVTEHNICMACNRDRAGNATSIIHSKLDYYYNLPINRLQQIENCFPRTVVKILNFLTSHPSSDLCTGSRLLNTLNIN